MSGPPSLATALDARIAAAYGVQVHSAPHLRGGTTRPESLVLAAEQLALAIGERPAKRAEVDEAPWAPVPGPTPTADAGAGADAAARLRAVAAWAEAGGIRFDAIELRVGADGNRTVHARRAIAEDEPLITVPRARMIVDADVAATPLGGAVDRLGDALRSQHSPFAAWLATERAAGAASAWQPYIAALPPAFPWVPIFRRGGELAALAGTRARDAIGASRASVVDDHALIQQRLRAAAAGLALGDFAWGRTVAMTRAFHVTIDGHDRRALIPIADMFDHGAADVTWAYDDAQQAFVVAAAHPLAAGDEIRAIYGRFENARFLACYGFAVADNPDDEVQLHLPRAAEARTDLAGHLVWGLPLAAPAALEVGARFDERFRRALSVARMRAATPRELVAAADRGRFLRGELRWLGARLEQAALDVLAAGARATLTRLRREPGGGAAGGARAGAGNDAGWAATCALVRASEAALLDEVLAFTAAARRLIGAPSPWAFRDAAAALDEDAVGHVRLLRGYLLAAADELPK